MWQPIVGKGRCFLERGVEVRWQQKGIFSFPFWTTCLFLCIHLSWPVLSLTQCFPSLKKVQLPSLSKLPFKSIDQKFMEKSKNQLNNFLQVRYKDKANRYLNRRIERLLPLYCLKKEHRTNRSNVRFDTINVKVVQNAWNWDEFDG